MTEWALTRVDLQWSVQAHPAAFQYGQFLLDFYTCYSSYRYYNAINQWYCLEYHPLLYVADPRSKRSTYMIRPSAQSPDYAIAEGLRPFRQWVQLTNSNIYIFDSFNLYVVKNRKSRVGVFIENWERLIKYNHLFTNSTPSLCLPDYSVHCGQFHSSVESTQTEAQIDAYLACPSSPTMV